MCGEKRLIVLLIYVTVALTRKRREKNTLGGRGGDDKRTKGMKERENRGKG